MTLKPFILVPLFAAFLFSCEKSDSGGAGDSVSTAAVESGPTPYPLTTCLVTGEPLDSKNDARTLIHDGREVKVCCAACQMSFKMKPGSYMSKLP